VPRGMSVNKSMTPPFRTGLEKGNNSISACTPILPGGAFKGGGKSLLQYQDHMGRIIQPKGTKGSLKCDLRDVVY